MDYSNIIEELNSASFFDIYRLSCALNQELTNDTRIQEVKKRLIVGQEISWFNAQSNKLEKATLLKCNKTRALVENKSDAERWNVHYAAINMEEVDVTIDMHQKVGLRKIELSLGDVVAFLDASNQLLYGSIEKLNPKTARITVKDVSWSVSYNLLRRADDIDAEIFRNNGNELTRSL